MIKTIKFEVQILGRTPVFYSVRYDYEKHNWLLYCDSTEYKLGTYDRLGQACEVVEKWHGGFTKVRAVC